MSPIVRFLLATAFAAVCIVGVAHMLSPKDVPLWAIVAVPAFLVVIIGVCGTVLSGAKVWSERD